MLGRAKAVREWFCGGFDGFENLAPQEIRSYLGGVLGVEPLRDVGPRAARCGVARGDCSHVIARKRGEWAGRSPMAASPLTTD